MDVIDDPESPDAAAPGPDAAATATLDLTPRDVDARPRRRTPWPAYLGLVLVLGGVAWVLVSGLNNATTFFYNVDDALAARSEIGDRRVRLQGNVVDGTVREEGGRVDFRLRYHDATVEVAHTGELPALFQPAIPVVVEGRFDGDRFRSDRILVKHDETYDEANPDRIRDARTDAEEGRTTEPAP